MRYVCDNYHSVIPEGGCKLTPYLVIPLELCERGVGLDRIASLKLHFVESHSAKPNEYTNPGEESPLCDLELSAQANSSDKRLWYAFRLEYRPHRVDFARAQLLAKTLVTIARGTRKLEDALGPVTTFGAYVGRIAHALNVANACSWSSAVTVYSQEQPFEFPISEAVLRLEHLTSTWTAGAAA